MFYSCHTHSYFSLGDALISPEKLIKRLKELNMDKVAITDHGNCSHIYKFSKKLKEAGIKYYPGEEFYFTPDSTLKDKDHRKAFHLLAIAKTEQGVKNLYKLSSLSFMEGFYYNPRIDFAMLEKYNEGLIFSTACISGLVPELIIQDRVEEAEQYLLKYKEILKENLYIEIMPHNLPDQIKVNKILIDLAKKHKIPLLATCDAHFCWKDEVEYRRFLILMNKAGWGKEDEDVGTLSSMYIMSEDDVRTEFKKYHNLSEADIDEAINNTQKVLEGEPPKLDTEEIKLPILKGGYATEEEYLLNLLAKGLKFRGVENNPVYIDRMKKEFAVIKEAGFINYFLVMEDLFNHCREAGIFVGPGRGSAAGCLIAYLLRITNIDPIKFGLIFERFYNAGRKGAEAAPDIDSDFEDERRGEVIKYLEDKYGADKISQICSVSQIKIKSGIKDVCRVLNISIEDANKLSSAIPWDEYDTLEEAEESNEDAKKIIADNPQIFEKVRYFLGFPRQMSKHAAGVVISSETIGNICPMMNTKVEKDTFLISQFDKNDIGHTGLIKFDILGLSTMTFIKHVLNQIKIMYNEDVDLLKINLDEKEVFKSIYQPALTDNVFQMESAGMKGYLKKIKPECLEDIIILNTLFRPAGLISGSLDKYVNNRFNPDNIQKFGIPEIDEILKKTYYILAYDESKMEIVMKFLDFTLYEANIFRKNIIKWKDHREHIESKFLQKAQEKGLTLENAKRLFEEMTGYAFCKAHSTAYSVLGYWCAWLKYHYPLAFLKASFIVSAGTETDKYNIQTAMKMATLFGYKILPPEINKSKANFYFDDNKKEIYWSFSLVKGIGKTAAESIEKCQPYSSFNDFITKIKGKKITKRAIVPLISLGAFDNLPNFMEELRSWWQKNKYEDSVDDLFIGNIRTRQSKHLGLILNCGINRNNPELQNCLDYDTFEKLPEKSDVILCGYYVDAEIKKSKKGKKYVILSIMDDSYSNYEVMLSEKTFAFIESKISLGDMVIFKAKKLDNTKLSLDKEKIYKLNL